jgi:hypothetical protein
MEKEIEGDSENFYINCKVPRKQSIKEQLENMPTNMFEYSIPDRKTSITIGCIEKGYIVVNDRMSNLCSNPKCPSCMGLKVALDVTLKNYFKN